MAKIQIMDELLLELDDMEYVRDISESDIFTMAATVNVNYDDETYAKVIIYDNGVLYVNFDSIIITTFHEHNKIIP